MQCGDSAVIADDAIDLIARMNGRTNETTRGGCRGSSGWPIRCLERPLDQLCAHSQSLPTGSMKRSMTRSFRGTMGLFPVRPSVQGAVPALVRDGGVERAARVVHRPDRPIVSSRGWAG